MIESGPLTIYCAPGVPTAKGLTFKAIGNGLYSADIALGEKNKEIVINR